jgi:hypothetical protein
MSAKVAAEAAKVLAKVNYESAKVDARVEADKAVTAALEAKATATRQMNRAPSAKAASLALDINANTIADADAFAKKAAVDAARAAAVVAVESNRIAKLSAFMAIEESNADGARTQD